MLFTRSVGCSARSSAEPTVAGRKGKSNSESAAIEYQHLQMRQLLLFSLSSQKNFKFKYSLFGGLQLLFPSASDRWFHRTSAAKDCKD